MRIEPHETLTPPHQHTPLADSPNDQAACEIFLLRLLLGHLLLILGPESGFSLGTHTSNLIRLLRCG